MANTNENYALGWDSEIENDGQVYELLEPGDYTFQVTGFERAQFAGNDKNPPCPMAKLSLTCTAVDGTQGRVNDTLFLNKNNEWRLCQFFTAIGQRQHGERLSPKWNQVMGASGMVKLEYDKKTLNDDGSPKYNRVAKYLEPVESVAPAKKWEIGK